MKKIYKRLIAYFIDMLVISIISMLITYIPVFKGDLVNYKKYIKEYNKNYTEYLDFNRDISKYFKDNELTEKEYSKLLEKHNNYDDIINKYYIDNKLTKKNYKKLLKDVNKRWEKIYKRYNYKLNKTSVVSNVGSFLAVLIYFLGIHAVFNGMTFGKKVMKLKAVSNTDGGKISFVNYLIRVIILYNPIYYLALVLGICIFNYNSFYTWSYVWSDIKSYLELVIVFMIIIRKDNRGLHELLSNTKVISVQDSDSIVKDSNKVTVIKKDTVKKDNKSKKRKKVIIDEE